jgi:macrodomain Ter protein organizer (MatP/YcbG family)
MAARPYTIVPADLAAARRYIDGAMKRGTVSSVLGWDAYRRATTADDLQTWCDDYLDRDIWKKLIVAVRQARKRAQDYARGQEPRHVDLSPRAMAALERIKTRYGLTASAAVLKLEEVHDLALDRGLIEAFQGPKSRGARRRAP